MSTLVTSTVFGLEQIQRQAFYVLFDELNPVIAQISAEMDVSDRDFATHTGRTYSPVVVEQIDANNFYEGHRPSLIKAPIDRYPNCSIWGVRAVPTPESAVLDQVSVYSDLLFIEVMCHSPIDEGEANKRLLRTVEAVNICIMRNQTLRGLVHGLGTDPTLNVSDVFTRRERTSYGPQWYWQGARLEYAVRKEAVEPSSTGSIFRAATPLSEFDIDQA
jgi:hypothetical protein